MIPSRNLFFHGLYRDISRAAADQLVARNRAAGGFDRSIAQPVEVIVPSGGVASQIARDLVAASPAGIPAVYLRTIDQLAAEICRRGGEVASVIEATAQTLAMQEAARPLRGDSDLLFQSHGLISMLQRSWRDVVDSGGTIDQLQRNVRRHPTPVRFQLVVDSWKRYQSLLRHAAVVEPSDVVRLATEMVRSSSVQVVPQVVFGFYDATGLQMAFLRALQEKGCIHAVYLPFDTERTGEGERYEFARRFMLDLQGSEESTPVEATVTAQRHHIGRFRSREEELRECCRLVATRLKAGADPSQIAVVRRSFDQREITLLQRHARDFGFTFNAAGHRPLRAHRIGRGLLLLLTIAEREFRRSDVIELLASGLSSSFLGFSPNVSRIDAASREAEIVGGTSATVQRAAERAELRDPEGVKSYLAALRRVEELSATVPKSATGGKWQELLLRIVRLFDARVSSDIETIAAIEAIAAAAGSLASTDASLDLADIIQAIDSTVVEGEPERGDIWIGDVMKLRGRSFRSVFAISMEDDVFPQQRSDDPVLPDHARAHFGLRPIGDGEEEEAMLFALLLDSAEEEIVFSFAAADVGGRVRRPSRLLVDYAIARHPAAIGEIVSDFAGFLERTYPAAADATPQFLRDAEELASEPGALQGAEGRRLLQAARCGSGSVFDGLLTPAEPLQQYLDAQLARTSPSRFEDFGECPHKFFLKSVLGIGEVEDPDHEIEMEVRKKGQLQHTILENFYRDLDPSRIAGAVSGVPPRLEPSVAALLEKTIDAAFIQFDLDHPPANPAIRTLEQKRLRRLLQTFVTVDLQLLAEDDFRPAHFEFRFGKDDEKTVLQIGNRQITVRGFIDRIDLRESDGRRRIVDYKSGQARKRRDLAKKIDAGLALQLPLYSLALRQIFDLTAEQIEACIRPLANPRQVKPFSFHLLEHEERLYETLALFVEAIARGSFPAFPNKDWCEYCAVANFCRTKHEPEEINALTEHEYARDLLEKLR